MMKNNYIKQKRKDQNPVNHWKIFEGRLVFLLAMVILAVVAYTFILQQAYTKTALKTDAKAALTKFAKVLVENPTMDIAVYGHTDNVGTLAANQKVSLGRANTVADYLVAQGATRTQMKVVEGRDYSMPVATNETADGRAQNRRVEVYMYASEKMIQDAQKEASN